MSREVKKGQFNEQQNPYGLTKDEIHALECLAFLKNARAEHQISQIAENPKAPYEVRLMRSYKEPSKTD